MYRVYLENMPKDKTQYAYCFCYKYMVLIGRAHRKSKDHITKICHFILSEKLSVIEYLHQIPESARIQWNTNYMKYVLYEIGEKMLENLIAKSNCFYNGTLLAQLTILTHYHRKLK